VPQVATLPPQLLVEAVLGDRQMVVMEQPGVMGLLLTVDRVGGVVVVKTRVLEVLEGMVEIRVVGLEVVQAGLVLAELAELVELASAGCGVGKMINIKSSTIEIRILKNKNNSMVKNSVKINHDEKLQ
jgi:hypothetical protein